MKKSIVSAVLGVILTAFLFAGFGCSQPGETVAEGQRRHIRNARINQQELMQDIDKVLLIDKPSKLTQRRVP